MSSEPASDAGGPRDRWPARWRRLTLPALAVLARAVLAAVFIIAGALKVTHLEESARAVRAYQLLPYEVAGTVGHALPVVEIAIGVLLLAGLFTRAAAVAGGLLLAVFMAGIASAWARGLSIDCGCFGGGGQVAADQTRYLPELARDAALLLGAAVLAARPRTPWAVDAALTNGRTTR